MHIEIERQKAEEEARQLELERAAAEEAERQAEIARQAELEKQAELERQAELGRQAGKNAIVHSFQFDTIFCTQIQQFRSRTPT